MNVSSVSGAARDMAYLGIKLGRHSVQAALWSENAGRPVEAHLPGLEVESASWHPVLGRDDSGRLTWGEDLWSRLQDVEPLEESLPELLGETPQLERLLAEQLWPELLQVAAKELRGESPHQVTVALTVEPTDPRREALARSLPVELELVGLDKVDQAALAAVWTTTFGGCSGPVLSLHLGGREVQAALWGVGGDEARPSFEALGRAATADASVGAVLEAILERATGEWGLLRLEEAGSEPERELLRRLRRDVLRRLGESRPTWKVAWQYEPPPGFRHLARWTHSGPAPLPSSGIEAVLSAAGETLDRLLDSLLAGSPEVSHLILSGAGASAEYFLGRLQRRFGRKRVMPGRVEARPALGAASLSKWARGETPFSFRAAAPEPGTAAPVPPPMTRIGLGLAVTADAVTAAWCREGAKSAMVLPLQGRAAVPAMVSLDREHPDVRHWGARAELLLADAERFATVRNLPEHAGSGVRFTVARKGSGRGTEAGADELLEYLLREAAGEAWSAAERAAGAAPGRTLCACAARVPTAIGLDCGWVSPVLAAWVSSAPDATGAGAVLVVDRAAVTGALLAPSLHHPSGWTVRHETRRAGFGSGFAAEILSRFLTDELNDRSGSRFRYPELLQCRVGTEERRLGDALQRAGEELAERLIRSPEVTYRVDLPGTGSERRRFEVVVGRTQWERWAGKRIAEAVVGVLADALAERPRSLLLAGGGAAIPLFRTAVEAVCIPLGIPVGLHPQPETAAALGAAMLAAAGGGPPELLVVGGPARAAAALVEAAARRGLDARLSHDGEYFPRAVVLLVEEPGAGSPWQDADWALRNGVPVLPLVLEPSRPAPEGAATAASASSLDTLSEADRDRIALLLDQAQRLLRSSGNL